MPDGTQRAVTISAKDLATMDLDKAINAYEANFRAVLPPHVPVERFKRMVLTAISTNPDLYDADRRTLFNAAVKCASDGLLPDGREAALVVYNTKAKDRHGNERYIKAAQYLPMIAGIRKRMRNTGEVLSAEAHVVYRHDKFYRAFGDDPKIVHEPPPLDQERGDAIGAYAIIKLANGEVIREVMPKRDIDRARAVSRSKDKGPWKDWWDEMARKTVLRRCAKAAPGSSVLERLLARDEEDPELPSAEEMPLIPPRPRREDFIEHADADDADVTPAQEPPFALVDADGVESLFEQPDEAAVAMDDELREAAKARGYDGAEGVWESNGALISALRTAGRPDLAEALDATRNELAVKYHHLGQNPGQSEDRLRAGAQQMDPAGGATVSPDHLWAEGQSTPLPKGGESQEVVADPNMAPPRGAVIAEIVPDKLKSGGMDWAGYAERVLAEYRRIAPGNRQGFRRANAPHMTLLRSADRDASTTLQVEMGQIDEESRQ